MTGRQRILPVRREYNRWVANQTLEDFALRFTARSARRWSALRVAQTALGSISFLALEAIGGTLILSYGFTNTAAAVMVVGLINFLTGLPISYYAARYGVDIDLLTRGAGFGYIGSTITSLIYATFTFIFFAIEAAIMALALQLCFGIPLYIGYGISAVLVIPLVTYGISLISRFQVWTQPAWIVLNLLPLVFIAAHPDTTMSDWTSFGGVRRDAGFDLVMFGAASGIAFSLIAQIGEQVDCLRFVPPQETGRRRWWASILVAGAGWTIPGTLKILLGSFLAVLALQHGVPAEHASEPTQMYAVAFGYVLDSPRVAIVLTGMFVILSQLKINVTNAYAGSIAWSNFFSRLTHSHPGRVVWLVFNVAIALLLMELGIYETLERTLGLYSIVAVAWVGALVADLAINKPLGLSPPGIEFKRAHLHDINPVGVGAMTLASAVALMAYGGLFGPTLAALSSFVALATALVAAPIIAAATRGRFYLARKPRASWRLRPVITCRVCEHAFEPDDMAFCPAYSGPICSLCCSLDARCHDLCKPHGRVSRQIETVVSAALPPLAAAWVMSRVGRYAGIMLLLVVVLGVILSTVYTQVTHGTAGNDQVVGRALSAVFFILLVVLGVTAWLFVLAQESRKVAQEESARQTTLHLGEIAAHRVTDAKLQRAKEVAEAANYAKSRYVVGISHELRTPLNAVLGYAQLLESDPTVPAPRQNGIRVIRRSAEHLSGLIDGLLDISKMEAGRLQLHRNEVRLADFLDQVVDMFRLQAQEAGLEFRFTRPERLPAVVATDEKRLRQVLINLLSNAIKFTAKGHVALDLTYRNQVAEFSVSDTGPGIPTDDLGRIFEPFNRGTATGLQMAPGTGLGLTIANLLAQIMGGEITVASRVGAGSTFRLRLMLSPVRVPSQEAGEQARITGYAGRRRLIVVVDDDPEHRELMREILVPLGFELMTAPDGATCLDLVEGCEPDLFMLDLAMPGMNGWELAARLRDSGHGSAATMIMSANVHEISPVREDGLSRERLMAKPFDLRALLAEIGRLLALDWTYDVARPAPPGPSAPVTPPSRREVEELIRLGQIGYVRGIEAKLTEIGQTAEQAGFVREMRGLIAAYDFRRYLAVLEDMRGHG